MWKRLSAILLAVCMLSALLPAASAADTTVVYDAAQYSVFQRSRQEIAARYNEAMRKGGEYDDNDSGTWYSRTPSLKSPYDEGAVRQSTVDAMAALTDFYRWLVGVQTLRRAASGSVELQKGALIRNWDFNHQVSAAKKPADMPQALWDAGAAANHNILALRYNPQEAVYGWCNEGYLREANSWDTVGHRLCLLSADVSEYAFGYSGDVAVGVIAANQNASQQPIAAFPAPGLNPTELYSAQEAAWSVELDSSKLTVSDENALRVTVTDSTGAAEVCTAAGGRLIYQVWTRKNSDISFAQPAAVGAHYPDGSVFQVVITGLTDVATGKPAELRYRVEFFEMLDYMETTVVSCVPEDISLLNVPADMNNSASLQMLSALLPRTAVATAGNGRTVELPIVGEWTLDMEKQCWTAQADASGLPQTITDPKGVLRRVSVSYQLQEYTGMLYLKSSRPSVGRSGELMLERRMLGTPNIRIYLLRRSADGWSAQLRFDQDSPYCENSRESATFTVKSWELRDQGSWLGVYYNAWGGWVVGPLEIDLGCTHENTETQRVEPGCTTPGREEVFCAACGALLSSVTLPALGHDWTTPSYVWSDDNTGVTASVVCRNDRSHTQTETVRSSFRITKQPTENEAGQIEYTAQFTNPMFSVQTKTAELQKLPCDGGLGCPGVVFADMPKKGNWAHDAIDWAIVHGITSGTSSTTFTPGGSCTRAQVVTFLWRASGCPNASAENTPFTDVKTTGFYYNAVLWAVGSGVTSGTSADKFSPNQVCTRGQVVTFLWRAKGKPAPRSTTNPFTDVKSSGFYYNAVLWAVENNVTAGTSADKFSPGGDCTRAQVVTFLYRASSAES